MHAITSPQDIKSRYKVSDRVMVSALVIRWICPRFIGSYGDPVTVGLNEVMVLWRTAAFNIGTCSYGDPVTVGLNEVMVLWRTAAFNIMYM